MSPANVTDVPAGYRPAARADSGVPLPLPVGREAVVLPVPDLLRSSPTGFHFGRVGPPEPAGMGFQPPVRGTEHKTIGGASDGNISAGTGIPTLVLGG